MEILRFKIAENLIYQSAKNKNPVLSISNSFLSCGTDRISGNVQGVVETQSVLRDGLSCFVLAIRGFVNKKDNHFNLNVGTNEGKKLPQS